MVWFSIKDIEKIQKTIYHVNSLCKNILTKSTVFCTFIKPIQKHLENNGNNQRKAVHNKRNFGNELDTSFKTTA